MSKKDPICGMGGTIEKHGYYFCSQNCIEKYESRPALMSQPWFKPVLYSVIAVLLIVLTAVLQMTGYMILFMGVFFVAVSLLKIADWKGFAQAFTMYDILAKKSKVYAHVYPLIELGLGISYLLTWQITIAAYVTFVIMAIGTVGVAQNLLSKNPVKCACLGTLVKIPLTKFTLFEDITMAAMALMILFF
jgi:YHS domain-containing protein